MAVQFLADPAGGNSVAVAVWRLEQRFEHERRNTQRQVQRIEKRVEEAVHVPRAEGRWAELEGYVDGLAETVHALVRRVEDTTGGPPSRTMLGLEDAAPTTFCEPPKTEKLEVAQLVTTAQQRQAARLLHVERMLEELRVRIAAVEIRLEETIEGRALQGASSMSQQGNTSLNSPSRAPPTLVDKAPVLLDSVDSSRASIVSQCEKRMSTDTKNSAAIHELSKHLHTLSESLVVLNSRVAETERGQKCFAEIENELGSRLHKLERVVAAEDTDRPACNNFKSHETQVHAQCFAGGHAQQHNDLAQVADQITELSRQLQEVRQDVTHVASQIHGIANAPCARSGELEIDTDHARDANDGEAFSFTGRASNFDCIGEQVADLSSRMQDVERGLQDAAELQDLRQQVSGVGEQVLRLLVRLQNVETDFQDSSERRNLCEQVDRVVADTEGSQTRLRDAERGLERLADAFSKVCGEVAELRGRMETARLPLLSGHRALSQKADVESLARHGADRTRQVSELESQIAELRLFVFGEGDSEDAEGVAVGAPSGLLHQCQHMCGQLVTVEKVAHEVKHQLGTFHSRFESLSSRVAETKHEVEGLTWVCELRGQLDQMSQKHELALSKMESQFRSGVTEIREQFIDIQEHKTNLWRQQLSALQAQEGTSPRTLAGSELLVRLQTVEKALDDIRLDAPDLKGMHEQLHKLSNQEPDNGGAGNSPDVAMLSEQTRKLADQMDSLHDLVERAQSDMNQMAWVGDWKDQISELWHHHENVSTLACEPQERRELEDVTSLQEVVAGVQSQIAIIESKESELGMHLQHDRKVSLEEKESLMTQMHQLRDELGSSLGEQNKIKDKIAKNDEKWNLKTLDVQDQLALLQHDFSKLQQSCGKADGFDADLQDLRSELMDMRDANSVLHEKLRDADEHDIQVQNSLEITKLRDQLTSVFGEHSNLHERIREQKLEMATLPDQFASVQGRFAQVDEKLCAFGKHMQHVVKTLDMHDLKDQLNLVHDEHAKARNRDVENQQEQAAQRSEMTRLQEQTCCLQEKIGQLQIRMQAVEDGQQIWHSDEIRKVRAQIDEVCGERGCQLEETRQLRSQLDMLCDEHAKARMREAEDQQQQVEQRNEIRHLQEQTSSFNERHVRLEASIRRVEDGQQMWQMEELKKLRTQVDDLCGQRHCQSEEMKKFRAEFYTVCTDQEKEQKRLAAQGSEDVMKLESKVDDARGVHARQTEQIEALRVELISVRSRNAEEQKRLAAQGSDDVMRLQSKVDDARGVYARQNEQIEALRVELRSVYDELSQGKARREDDHEADVEQRSSIQELQEQTRSLQEGYTVVQRRMETVEDESSARRKEEMQRWQAELEVIRDERVIAESRILEGHEQYAEQIRDLGDQLSGVYTKYDEMLATIRGVDDRHDGHSGAIGRLRARLDMMQDEHRQQLEQRSEINTLRERLCVLQDEHAELQEKTRELGNMDQHAAASDGIEHLQQLLGSMQSKHVDLYSKIDEARQYQCQIENNVVVELKEQLSHLHAELAELRGSMCELGRFEHVELRLEAAEAHGLQEMQVLDNLRERMAWVCDQLGELKKHFGTEVAKPVSPRQGSDGTQEQKANAHAGVQSVKQWVTNLGPGVLSSEQHVDIDSRLKSLECCLQDLTATQDVDLHFRWFCDRVAAFQEEVQAVADGAKAPYSSKRLDLKLHAAEQRVNAEEGKSIEDLDTTYLSGHVHGLEQLARKFQQRTSLDEIRAEALDAVDLRVTAVSDRLVDACERLQDMERDLTVSGRSCSQLRSRFDRLEGSLHGRMQSLSDDLADLATRQLATERGLLAAVAHSSTYVGGGSDRARKELQAHLAEMPASPALFRSPRGVAVAGVIPKLPSTEPDHTASLQASAAKHGAGASD